MFGLSRLVFMDLCGVHVDYFSVYIPMLTVFGTYIQCKQSFLYTNVQTYDLYGQVGFRDTAGSYMNSRPSWSDNTECLLN